MGTRFVLKDCCNESGVAFLNREEVQKKVVFLMQVTRKQAAQLTHDNRRPCFWLLEQVAPLPGPDAGHVTRKPRILEVLLHVNTCR